jgi:diaminopimelate decarboxylase
MHAVAAKANSLQAVLSLVNSNGGGCEAASLGELQSALRAGFPPNMIVFDSPVKTTHELAFALRARVLLK